MKPLKQQCLKGFLFAYIITILMICRSNHLLLLIHYANKSVTHIPFSATLSLYWCA